MSRSILAVDPGKSGAIAFLEAGSRLEIRRDFKSFYGIAKAIQELASLGATDAVIEFVHARPGEGVCSVFTFGKATGVALGALINQGFLTPHEVHPLKWQNHFRRRFEMQKGQEFDSRALATALFPSRANLFTRKKDHNSADAALMAVWYLETVLGGTLHVPLSLAA